MFVCFSSLIELVMELQLLIKVATTPFLQLPLICIYTELVMKGGSVFELEAYFWL